MEGELKLLGVWGSPFVRRVQMVLDMKGIKYEYFEDDLKNKSPLLLKHNPIHKKVPVLLHNGKPIVESLVIIEYIDETWTNNPILPRDPYDRAMARFWGRFIDDKCTPAVWKALWSAPGEEREKAYEEACGALEKLEAHIKANNKKFFGGDSVGYVDITANFLGYWSLIVGELNGFQILTKDKFPALCEWVNNFQSSPLVKPHLPPKDKLMAVFKAIRDGSVPAPRP